MYKAILAPLGGGESDFNVLDAALAVARKFDAHIECFHGLMHAGEAASASRQIPFLVGPALHEALDFLEERGRRRTAAAREHYSAFCECHELGPWGGEAAAGVSVGILESRERVVDQLLFHIRHHDLTVMARPAGRDGLPAGLLSRILRESGQPLLLAPTQGEGGGFKHPLVCWKDTRETARAISLAMPLLRKAGQVTLVTVDDGRASSAASVDAIMRRLARQGLRVEEMRESASGRRTMDVLQDAARDRGADYLVMGAGSKGGMSELLFGSCTEDALERGGLPILIAH